MFHFDLVPDGHPVNARLYAQQPQQVYDALKDRYPILINQRSALLQYDNASACTVNVTRRKLEELEGLEVLLHPACSPELSPSDYHLSRAMSHFLHGERLNNMDEIKNGCRELFASNLAKWYKRGTELLTQ
ncbi:histone-lysine N-methyltransferase SETMAR-like [Octopus bimaculoides]|uniref:histone-lysine N-methyltransferase SETMAR-like n=1 Tax=Octopus bimaculoides TaxID=37653 RepID=UPI00071C6814|nr:histone-lysine N-methyltransferase SETMAR-like [Octopus bimaculoides]|eukprot:XP_014768565.1 PREDICTED: histone-lysine N-methyltransferase SETMAR-like [Octopus bimaculoides]